MLKLFLLNGWFFSFIIGWVVFFLLVDWYSFKKNVWAGIVCIILEVFQDTTGVHSGTLKVQSPGLSLLGTSAFFTFGIAFIFGVLFMQYLPGKNILQLINIIVFASGFLLFEFILVSFGLLVHIHYNYFISLGLNIVIMGSLAWFKQIIYKPKPKRGGIMWKYYLFITLEGIVIYIWCRIIKKLDKKYPN